MGEAVPRSAGRRGIVLALVSLLIAGVVLCAATFFKPDFREPVIELAWQRMIQSARASQALPPVKFAGQSMRSLMSSGLAVDSPFQRLALTAVAAASNRGDGVRVRGV